MRYDFLIIGGGIAGTSLGGRLASSGSVCLLESEDAIGYHASGRSAAMFLENYGNDIVVELNKASTLYHKKNGYLSDRGLISLARAQDKDNFFHEVNALNLEIISMNEALDLFPIINTTSVKHVSFLKQAPDLDTDKILQDFAKMIKQNKGVIRNKTTVKSIKKLSKHWQVETNAETFEGTVLINAAGAWVDQIAKMASIKELGFMPMRRSIARVPSPIQNSISNWPMVHGAGDRWYAKPDAGAWLISPCEEDPMHPHDAFADDMILAEGIHRYSQMVNHEITNMQTSWAGLRTFSQDHALVIGFDKDGKDFFWFAGQGGYGFQTAPAASQLASDLILKNISSLTKGVVKALSPKRFY